MQMSKMTMPINQQETSKIVTQEKLIKVRKYDNNLTSDKC